MSKMFGARIILELFPQKIKVNASETEELQQVEYKFRHPDLETIHYRGLQLSTY